MKSIVKDLLLATLQNSVCQSKTAMDALTANMLLRPITRRLRKNADSIIAMAAEALLNSYDTACQFYMLDKIDKDLFDSINNPIIWLMAGASPFKKRIASGDYKAIQEWMAINPRQMHSI